MRLLFISPYPPRPIRRRPYELIRRLAARHDVMLATLVAGPDDAAAVAELRALGIAIAARPIGRARRAASMLAGAARGLPLQARYDWHPALAADLRGLARARPHGPGPVGAGLVPALSPPLAPAPPFDAVHVEHLRGACYGLAVCAAAPELPVVWDAVDCISRLFEQAAREAATPRSRLIARFELARTRRYEAGLPARFSRTAITSAADRDALLALAEGGRDATASPLPRPPITVIPNGVDLDYFVPPDPANASARDPATILFTGKLGYHANVAAVIHLVQRVMPPVWAAHADARVVLAGADPAPVVLALARADPGRVTVTGAVPDLRPYLHAATVAVVPLVYGVGIQNKVLEAMACGVPVVASRAAATALSADPGRELLLGDAPDDLAAAIVALLADPARAAGIGAAGRAYVEREHGWDRAMASFEALYAGAGSSRSGR